MSETIIRQWLTLSSIPRAPAFIDVPTLKGRLEREGYSVHARTLQRDLQTLSVFFPLVSDESEKPFKWQWQKDAKVFDLPSLTPSAALTLSFVEQYLSPILPATTLANLEPHFKTAAGVLTASAGSAARWKNKIRVLPRGQRLLPPKINSSVQQTVYAALLDDQQLSIRYLPRWSKRHIDYDEVHPLAIVLREPVVYLVCHFWDYGVNRQDVRQLALHRIAAAQRIDKSAKRIKEFDIDDYIDRGEFGISYGRTIKLVADFTEEAVHHLLESPLSADQSVSKQRDGQLRLTATLPDTDELRWWLLSIGSDVRIIKPAVLVNYVRDISSRVCEQYREG